MKALGKFADAVESLPWLVKVLLVICFGVYGNLIRLFRSCGKENVIGVILALVLLLCGGFFILWIIDLVFVLLNKKIWWID